MGFNCGIVGLPNVGKSTLFNALTSTMAAQAANYPFCTIEPNVGRVSVPDARLDVLTEIEKSQKTVPAQLEFVDIAGLIRGASKGEGLGNQFLGNIREVDAVVHVLRCFENDDITHVYDTIDPIRDAETVDTELMYADLESMERRIVPIEKKAKSGEKEAKQQLAVMQPVLEALRRGEPARTLKFDGEEESKIFKQLYLLSAKPVLYVCNVEETAAATGNDYSKRVAELADKQGYQSVLLSAAIEAELACMGDPEGEKAFLEDLGLRERGLNRVIRAGYKLLNLQTYFTAGPKESKAWTITKGMCAPQAAGVIHSDFEKGFIRAEVISYDDFVACRGEAKARESGKLRSEGKSYVVQDGDVCHFLFNV